MSIEKDGVWGKVRGRRVGVTFRISGGARLGGSRLSMPHLATTVIFGMEGMASLFEKPLNIIVSRVDTILDEVKASKGVDGFLDGGEERELEGRVLAFRSHR
jgi:hypothetical protein